MRRPGPGSRRPVEPTVPPAEESAIAREQVRGPARRDRAAAAPVPPAGDPLLLRGPHPRRGGAATPMPGRHAPQPAGPGAGEAPPRPDPSRLRPLDDRAGRRAEPPVGLGVHLAPPVRHHRQGRDPFRGPAGRRVHREHPGPGGPPHHDDPQAEDRDRDARVPGCPRHRRRLSGRARSPWATSPARPQRLPQAPAGTRPDRRRSKSAPGRMFVVGRVLDPQGKPVPNATVDLSAAAQAPVRQPRFRGGFPAPAGHGASDASGRFRFDAARASSAHHAQFGATARAPGYGVGWADLDPDEDQPSAEIRLMPEQVIEGRLFDVQGQPVPGAVVSVSAIWRTLAPTVLAQGRAIENHSGRTTPLVGPRPRRAGLAEAGDDRRRRPLRPARHRPRPACQAERPRPAVRPADDRGRHRRPRGRQDPEGGAPAGPDPHRPRDLCRHRPAGRSRRGPRRHGHRAGRSPGGRIRYLAAEADAEGRFRVGVMPGDRTQCLGCRSRRATLPPRRREPGMAQGGDRAGRRPGVAPRRR